jgi:EAL domain-containing protein (putative c-di-GMP-specific phosphodiesterase class I)
LNRLGVPAHQLCLELTESSIMADFRRTAAVLERLRAVGVIIAIDDFGTGHSSLAYLKRLPVDELKIDKSFVLSMINDHSDEAIVDTILNLARNLGVGVVAEGIEDDAIASRLRALGCPTGQGYLFARPMPNAQLLTWLSTRDPSRDDTVVRFAARQPVSSVC